MDNNINNTQAPQNNAKAFSITALVTGILSIVGSFIPFIAYFTLVLGIVGIVFGVKGRKLSPQGQRGMATAGFVCAIVGTSLDVLSIVCILACAGVITSAANSIYFY